MTKEEAIIRLDTIKSFIHQDGYTDKVKEAIDMAIKILKEGEILEENSASDLISRQDTINVIEKTEWYHIHNGRLVSGANSTQHEPLYKSKDIYNALNGMPSIRSWKKKGRWLINSDGYYPYCSECMHEPKSGNMTDFCPSCGAEMRY